MRRFLTALAAIVALSACATAATEQGAATQQTLNVAPLQYHYRQLANGLRVYAMPDPATANVSVQVWYRVGSKNDPLGRSGFAHLFEHMLFKATRNMPEEFFDRLTDDVGGTYNASTYDDFTNYYEVVPANHLERLLWAEAERMGSLVVDQATFDAERDVVKEELRQRVLASPYGRLFYLYLTQVNFDVHPYGRPGIGSIEDLDAATVEDLRAFHATYYRPDNAVLVVAGNFNEAQFDAWVDHYFAPIARPDRAIPRVTAVEPERTAPRAFTAYEPNVPLPAIMVSYPAFNANHPDLAALLVLDGILSTGDSSRMYQTMVYGEQIAAQVFTNFEATHEPSPYSLFAILSQGQSADAGLASLDAILANLRDMQVSQAELDEAKNELLSATIQGRETALGRANELADAITRYGDPAAADRILAQIQAVTAADVQRVARTWLNDQRRVVVRYLPEESRAADVRDDEITTAATIQADRLSIPASEIQIVTLAPEASRVAPPAPGAPVAARVPATAETTLANGLRVIVASDRDLPLISGEVRIGYGFGADSIERAGLAAMTAELTIKGTATRSATDIARQIESLGAAISSGAVADSSFVAVQATTGGAAQTFAILSDVVRNPVFAGEELQRVQQNTLDGLSVALSDPGSIAQLTIPRAIYGAGPYGRVASPTSVQAITSEESARYHRTYWRPDAAVLVISGDVTAEQGFALARSHFGDWARPNGEVPALPDASVHAEGVRTIVVDLPDTGQAAVYLGLRGLSRTDADYFPALMANEVLGGGSASRLFQEVRTRRGLSYGAYSSMPSRRAPGPIIASAQTRNDAAVQVVEVMQAEFSRIGDTEPDAEELGARQATLIGAFGRNVETTAGVATQLAILAQLGIAPDQLAAYPARVSAVTAAQVRAAGERYFDPARADLVVVGDAQLFYDELRRARPNAERIRVDDLNLDNEALH